MRIPPTQTSSDLQFQKAHLFLKNMLVLQLKNTRSMPIRLVQSRRVHGSNLHATRSKFAVWAMKDCRTTKKRQQAYGH